MPEKKKLRVNLFEMNCVGHGSHGLWVLPGNQRVRFNDIEYWTELAQILEAGAIDALFLADVIGTYDGFRGGPETAIREAVQIPNNDPMLVVPAMAAVTSGLGFAITFSTTYEPPFAFARRMRTLDHLTKGRVAWNVVTSYLPNAARNFGLDDEIDHDTRYDIAEEYMEVLYKLWEGSWDDDAVLVDREHGVYADPAKIHYINHVGARYRVAGPHLSQPSRQRTPVIYQAGSSPAGRAFGGKHAEAVFIGGRTLADVRSYIEGYRAEAASFGRSRDAIRFMAGAAVIVGRTDDEVAKKVDLYKRTRSVEGHLAHAGAGLDWTKYKAATTVREIVEAKEPGYQRLLRQYRPEESVGEILANIGEFRRGAFYVAGTPREVADAIETWLDEGDIDGINLRQFVTPGTAEDFVELVIPELRRRGRFRESYDEGETLRARLFGAGHDRLPDDHPAVRYRGGAHLDPAAEPELQETSA